MKKKCSVCGKENKIVLHQVEYQNSNYRLYHCLNCGFAYIDLPEMAARIYTKDFFENYDDTVKKTFIGGKGFKRFENYLTEINKEGFQTGKILEIGCAFGYFLKVCDQQGWQTYGVDISKHALKTAKKITKAELKYVNTDTDPLPFKNNYFDVVASFDVLEHVKDSGFFFKEISRVLKKGGLLYLKSFNFNGLGRILQGTRWPIMAPPVHRTFHSRQSVKKILAANRFIRIRPVTYGITVWASQNPKTNAEIKSKLIKNPFFLIIWKLVILITRLLRIGDYMTVYAVKK